LRRHTRLPSPASTRTVWALVIGKVDPDQPSVVHLVASLAVVACWAADSGAALAHGHGPKGAVSDDGTHSCSATGPDPAGSGHFPHPGHPWPAKGGNQTNEAQRTSAFLSRRLNATPEPAGMRMQPWDLGTDQAPRSLT
jgi:hypothetical protein